jgi:hypothetical protein
MEGDELGASRLGTLTYKVGFAFPGFGRLFIIAAEVHLFQPVLQYYQLPICCGNSTLTSSCFVDIVFLISSVMWLLQTELYL